DEDRQGPLCPACRRPVGWVVVECPHCGEALEAEGRRPRRLTGRPRFRLDWEPHRAALLLRLGQVSCVAGALSLCLCGLGAILSVPLGITVWVLVSQDLRRMDGGQMDPGGRGQTWDARTYAILGILLGIAFASVWVAAYWPTWL